MQGHCHCDKSRKKGFEEQSIGRLEQKTNTETYLESLVHNCRSDHLLLFR